MNRHYAIQALVEVREILELPELTRIIVAQLKPGDVIVIESEERLRLEHIERLHDMVSQVWPGLKVVVLDNGLKLTVIQAPP